MKKGKKRKQELCNWKDNYFQSTLQKICTQLLCENILLPPFRFFTQNNRSGIIFRADPCYEKKSNYPWYDWAYIDWGEASNSRVPCKLLLFIEINEEQFLNPFKFGEAYITEPGTYAICYSFNDNTNEKAHCDSLLISYGCIVTDNENMKPILYAVNVDSIVDNCLSVPYKTKDNIINAIDWLIIHPMSEWSDILIKFMKENK